MNITIHGHTYILKNNAIRTEMVSLLNDEDTTVLYISADKTKIDDYDTILLINTSRKSVFPVFLSVFNDMVEPYYIPLKYVFPAFYVIESSAIDFACCDFDGISKLKNYVKNNYIAYGIVDNILLIATDFSSNFEMFGTKKIAGTKKPEVKKTMLYEKEKTTSVRQEHQTNNPPVQQPRKAQPKPTPNNTFSKPTTPPKQSIPQVKVPEMVHTPARPVVQPTPVPQKPATNVRPTGSSKENLFKYCSINENCLIINLAGNREVAVIDKKLGSFARYSYDELLSNNLIGYSDESQMLQAFGKTPLIMYDTYKLCVTDIRTAIRMFEQRKESPVTKQMVAYNEGSLYVAFASEASIAQQTSIKNFAIESHKNAVQNYEKVKTVAKAYAKDVYCVLTKSNIGILVVSDSGKKANYLPLEEIYTSMPEVQNIGDIIRLFPIERIIDGTIFNIDSIEQVRSVVDVLPQALNLASEKYTVKGFNFGYDRQQKIITKAPVTTE